MFYSLKKICVRLSLVLAVFIGLNNNIAAQTRVKKVVLQGFWWDNWNNNFRFKWADYLVELAPRIKALGVDAIWIPPNIKNDGPGSVGYMPFDHYDLGDKYQKGETLSDTVRTRSGNKDELLRLIAVMHANGIEVIQDIVLNHSGGAGNRGGGGGRDYNAASAPYTDATNGFSGTNYFKNFRYVSYATPHLDTSAADYFTRTGRWYMNLPNFYPNPNNNVVNTTDMNKVYFGPDMAYENNSIGKSFTIPASGSATINGITKPYFNPTQPSNYMAQSAKDWIVWYKKQTGADGFRWDAVKHFGFDVQRDLTYALKYQSGFANGGNSMFNVGEWVGSTSEVDYYANQLVKTGTPAESGVTDEQMSGGFDFGLRGYGANGGIYAMVLGQGNFNMQNIPGAQQSLRYFDYPNGTRVYKTVPFVNSHDTYRPVLSTTGNYSQALGNSAGWNTSNELGGNGQHIDPREPRFAAANAVIAAVDGNPCFFIEDVFDYFSKDKRWTHSPANADSLPLRADVGNIMQCHQALKFKDGDYGVPTAITGTNAPVYASGSSGDHLVIERFGKAIIGISDAYSSAANNSADQQVWVSANSKWDTGTLLYDYSGAHGIQSTKIYGDRRVLIKTAPCGHNIPGAYGHGYSIWAPYTGGTPTSVQDLFNVLTTYNQPLNTSTTQEWEMADDLGDSHCASLGQGGQLPVNSTNQRVAGKIFVQSGKPVTYKLTPTIDNNNLNIALWDLDGNILSQTSGVATLTSPLTGNYTPTFTGWATVKVRQQLATQVAQKAYVNVNYTAPTTVNTRDAANSAKTRVCIWTGNKGTTDITDCGNWEEGIVPDNSSKIIVPAYAMLKPDFPNSITGRIISPKGDSVNLVTMNITNAVGSYSITSGKGSYQKNSLTPRSYVIKPYKNNDVTKANGVTASDVLFIQRHILGTAKLNAAYKIIAADVDGNKQINATDVLRVKRLILGTDTTFKNTTTNENRTWVFVDSTYQFTDTANPFPFRDSIVTTATLNNNNTNKTFIGIKLGDVNYDWKSSVAKGTEAKKAIELFVNENDLISNNNQQNLNIKFYSSSFTDITAMQSTIHFDNSKYEFVSLKNEKLDIAYNASMANKTGNVSLLWTDKNGEAKSFDESEQLFILELRVLANAKTTAQLSLSNDVTPTLAYDNSLNERKIILTKRQINNQQEISNIKQWFSVYPNPAKDNVTIQAKGVKELQVMDVMGKMVNRIFTDKELITINTKKLGKGLFVIKAVMSDGSERNEKLVVE